MNAYLYGYTTPPKRKTLAELEQIDTWRRLDPEFKRRLIAIFDASGLTLGFGGGWRSSAQQEALFRSRYHVVAGPTGILWDGKYWAINPGVAPSTPPGRSYHEETTPVNCALAADLIGDLTFLDKHGKDYGLRDLSDVNNEPWHAQPVELPTARRQYTDAMHPLKVWQFPGAPTPPGPTPAPPSTSTGDEPMFTNSEPRTFQGTTHDPRKIFWYITEDGHVRHITRYGEVLARGGDVKATGIPNSALDELGA